MEELNEISLRERIRLNLVSYMESADINQVQLAEKLGISKGTVNNWARGNNSPDVDMVPKICKILGISIPDLYAPTKYEVHEIHNFKKAPSLSDEAMKLAEDYDGRMDDRGRETVRCVADLEVARFKSETAATLRKSREQSEAAEEIAPNVSEMLIYINPAAAGMPLYAESDFERMEFLSDQVPRGTDFGIRISGRSMEPTVMDGSIAWVRKRLEIPNGTVGIFMLNDSAVCKRFFKESDGSVRLKSDNPEFPDVSVTEFDSFIMVGEVIGTVLSDARGR